MMPLYTYWCRECKKRTSAFRRIDDRHSSPECCCTPTKLIIEAPNVHGDIPSYQSPIDGRWIDGKKARMEDLKRNNCRPWEGMESEKKEAQKRAEYVDRKYDQGLEKAIYNTYNNMSAEKQKALEVLK